MSEYEFSNEENITFLTYIKRSIILTIGLMFAGILLVIEGAISPVESLDIATGFIFILVGAFLFAPLQNFLNIIVSQGNDVSELMKGFTSFGNGMTVVMVALGANFLLLLFSLFSEMFN